MRRHKCQPVTNARIGLEAETALVGDVRVGIQCDVCDGQAVAHEVRAIGEVRLHHRQGRMAAGPFGFVVGSTIFGQSEEPGNEARGD